MNEVKYEEEFDEESLRDLLSLTKNMDVEPKRNELCYCMSGKKYKKCCMDKESQSDTKAVELKDFYLIPDTSSEVFQYDMSDEDYNIAADCYELLLTEGIEEDPEAIECLDTLLKKYPDHPALNTAQALRCLMNEENEVFEKTIKRNLEKFPDDKINRLLLKYHEYDLYANQFFPKIGKATEKIFPEGLDLKDTYDKEQVLLTEFLLAISLQIYETLFKEKLLKAMDLIDMMGNILENIEWDSHFLLARMEHLIMVAKFIRRIKIFLANSSEERINHHGAIPINA